MTQICNKKDVLEVKFKWAFYFEGFKGCSRGKILEVLRMF